ncbi:MAG: hypothetical protein RLZZ385_392 [Pseudomonadota bacterium]|jgi:FMN-dependent NADH-azoreductase
MTKLLQLKSSLFDANSVSNQLSDELLSLLPARGLHITTRDFSSDPVPHLDGAWQQALSTPAADRSDEQQAKVAYSDSLIAQVQETDLLVMGAPMYNFTLPSMLKAWLDHLARAGVTFKYSEQGPVGLLTGKKVVVVATMGGHHEVGHTDHLRPYLKTMLGFVGLRDVEFAVAAGLNMGPEHRTNGLADARRQIRDIAAGLQSDVTDKAAA